MTKKGFAEKLAKQADISIAKANEILTIIFDCKDGQGIIATELEGGVGSSVVIPGFGTFETKHREARTGRNPSTGKSIKIKAKDYPVFRAGKTLKDRIEK
jgi:nucleoid DNA-binding protein